MQPNDKRSLVMITAVLFLAVSGRGRYAGAREDVLVSHEGVTARILAAPFSGETASLAESTAATLSLDQLPKSVTGCPVLETKRAIVSWAPDRRSWELIPPDESPRRIPSNAYVGPMHSNSVMPARPRMV
ncbi:MAG: hypothetical protein ACYC3X_05195 [Pirellulaceae bacterium]